MTSAIIAVVLGLVFLVWSADRFIEGSAAMARHFGISPLVIGMVIVGFGTSAPEMVVSAISAWQGDPGIALGNAYGSNITNTALILGITALVAPIVVRPGVLRKELPLLCLATLLSAWQISDGRIDRFDAWTLLVLFFLLIGWTLYSGFRAAGGSSSPGHESGLEDLENLDMPIAKAMFWLLVGLVLLVVSSRVLVWGSVRIARGLGVDDLVIGLTIVALGTSLPELASSVAAARKKEHDIALGNVLGSNLFNILAVVGIAGAISPMDVEPVVLKRDVLTVGILTLSLFVFGYGRGGPGKINRPEGFVLVLAYLAYMTYLVVTTFLAGGS